MDWSTTLTEENLLEMKRLQYEELQKYRRREIEKTIYRNANWYDKIKIRLRRFFESRRK